MASTDQPGSASSTSDVALIVGGGPGISASCARLFAHSGMAVAMAARNPDKPVLKSLARSHGVRPYACDAADAAAVAALFDQVTRDLGAPRLVVHHIDGRVPGIFRQGIHVANVPIDAAVGWRQEDGSRAHRPAGTTTDDNMADPDHIAQTYLQLHRQHRSTWACEVVLRPWNEKW